ncbi:MAG: hypothetical protein M0Q48_10630 [Verrucomicrobia bacterium]|nr:hypothetical protein [Verrucomicrobiota bacterium]
MFRRHHHPLNTLLDMNRKKILYVSDGPEMVLEKKQIEEEYNVKIVLFHRFYPQRSLGSEISDIISAALQDDQISGVFFSIGEKNELCPLCVR